MNGSESVFGGSIPRLYEEYLVPLIFEPYADDMARRLASRSLASVLEIAAGTGVVTRRIAAALPASVAIVATGLNQPMIDLATTIGTRRPCTCSLASATTLRHRPRSSARSPCLERRRT